MPTRSLTSALLCTGLLVAGCGGGDDEETAAESTPEATAAVIAAPFPTVAPSATPKAGVPVGGQISVAKYADVYCRSIANGSQAALKLSEARAKAAERGKATVAELTTYLSGRLTAYRADVVRNLTTLRRIGYPKAPNGKKFAQANQAYYDNVAVADKAIAALKAIKASSPAAYAKAAGKVVSQLQTDVDARAFARSKTVDALKPQALDDAVGRSKLCEKLLTL